MFSQKNIHHMMIVEECIYYLMFYVLCINSVKVMLQLYRDGPIYADQSI